MSQHEKEIAIVEAATDGPWAREDNAWGDRDVVFNEGANCYVIARDVGGHIVDGDESELRSEERRVGKGGRSWRVRVE